MNAYSKKRQHAWPDLHPAALTKAEGFLISADYLDCVRRLPTSTTNATRPSAGEKKSHDGALIVRRTHHITRLHLQQPPSPHGAMFRSLLTSCACRRALNAGARTSNVIILWIPSRLFRAAVANPQQGGTAGSWRVLYIHERFTRCCFCCREKGRRLFF